MGLIDGEELTYVCNNCGHKFRWIVGYGPVCPNPILRAQLLKKNPPQCPHCKSRDVKRCTIFGAIFGVFRKK